MKRLLLIRHAKSSSQQADLPDFDRPLNDRGVKDAPFMGRRLQKFKVVPDLIISSPACRARTTAEMIAREVGFPVEKIIQDEKIYQSDVIKLLWIIRKIDDAVGTAMILGHNPEFTELAWYLTTYPLENIPTCGILCLDFDVNHWHEIAENTGLFRFFDYPKKHK